MARIGRWNFVLLYSALLLLSLLMTGARPARAEPAANQGRSGSSASSPDSTEGFTLFRKEANQRDRDKYVEAVYCVTFSPDGKTLASVCGDATIKLWNMATREEAATMVSPKAGGNPQEAIMIRSLAFSPDGKTLASADTGNTSLGMIRLWDVASARNIANFNGHSQPWRAGIEGVYCVVFSPDGKRLASGHEDNLIRFWDVGIGMVAASFEAEAKDYLYSVSFSPDGRLLASGGHNGTIKLWNVASGKNTATFKAVDAGNSVYSLAFSPDGKTLAAACWTKGGMLWDLASGKNTARFDLDRADSGTNPNDMAYSVAFSPDSTILAVGCSNGLIGLWDVAGQKKLAVLRGHSELVRSLAFSPDGKTLASGSNDRTVKLWNVDTSLSASGKRSCRSPKSATETKK